MTSEVSFDWVGPHRNDEVVYEVEDSGSSSVAQAMNMIGAMGTAMKR
jgi:hypothetical protein